MHFNAPEGNSTNSKPHLVQLKNVVVFSTLVMEGETHTEPELHPCECCTAPD